MSELRSELRLAPMRGSAVILIHGLADTRWVMSKLADYLEASKQYDHVVNWSYASTRDDIAEHSAALAEVISNMETVQRIDMVGYSLGGIVVRHYWGRDTPDTRINRVVMLASPNKGAQLANRLGKQSQIFDWIVGKSARQLGTKWRDIEPQLATPTCEFGIVAGSVSGRGLDNPLIDGEDDMIVAVNETLLAGAADFVAVPFTHTEIPKQRQVWGVYQAILGGGSFYLCGETTPDHFASSMISAV